MSKLNIGKMDCETRGCDNVVTVKQNEHGTLSYRCDECDAAPYARTGTRQNELWRSNLRALPKNEAHNEPINDLNQEVKAVVLPNTAPKLDIWGNPL